MRTSKEFVPIRITITNSKWSILHDLGIDTPAQRIEEILGTPTKVNNNVMNYCGETKCVNFHVRVNKIVKIELIYYAD